MTQRVRQQRVQIKQRGILFTYQFPSNTFQRLSPFVYREYNPKGFVNKEYKYSNVGACLHTNFHLIPFKDFHHSSTESTTQKGSSTKSMNIATWAPIQYILMFIFKIPSHKTFNIRLQKV